jgi:hypothetical protein
VFDQFLALLRVLTVRAENICRLSAGFILREEGLFRWNAFAQ